MKGYEYQSDFAKLYVAHGRIDGVAHALLIALRVRGIVVSESARAWILTLRDPELLDRWLARAIVATSLAEVLDETVNEAGRRHAWEEAYAQGIKKGMRSALLRQLRKRFGELPASAVARVERAEATDIEQWADLMLTATTLDEVLGEPS
jgi:flagellar biosynthesis/type III secretory pathway protein FliH